jgi:hypothetical protein
VISRPFVKVVGGYGKTETVFAKAFKYFWFFKHFWFFEPS